MRFPHPVVREETRKSSIPGLECLVELVDGTLMRLEFTRGRMVQFLTFLLRGNGRLEIVSEMLSVEVTVG